jgi:hypothetical protein
MPYVRKMHPQELGLYAMNDPRLTLTRIAEIETAVAAGGVLQLECSTVRDAYDYTRVLLDGREVARAKGY